MNVDVGGLGVNVEVEAEAQARKLAWGPMRQAGHRRPGKVQQAETLSYIAFQLPSGVTRIVSLAESACSPP